LKIIDAEVHGHLSKIANLVGLGEDIVHRGLVQEASRSKTVIDRDDPEQQKTWGVAVRLVVATTETKTKVSVSVPAIAAEVELGFATASAAIDVSG
jgi:hypothetical protein